MRYCVVLLLFCCRGIEEGFKECVQVQMFEVVVLKSEKVGIGNGQKSKTNRDIMQ